MKPAVLFTHVRGSDEMAEALLLKRDVEIIVTYDSVCSYFDAKGIPYTRLFSFLTQDASQRCVVEAAVRAEHAGLALDNSLANHWPDWSPELRADIARRFQAKFQDEFLNEALLIDCVRTCAAQRDLRAVVVPQDISRDTKSITFTAQRLGVPVIHLLHGYPCGTDNLHEDCYADWLAVFSDHVAGIYAGFGMPTDRICVTGNPYWDNFARPPRPALRKKALAKLGLDGEKPILVYALLYEHALSANSAHCAGYTVEAIRQTLEALGSLSERYPDWQIVVRPHPNWVDYYGDLNTMARGFGMDRVWIDCELAPMSACAIADLLICTQSNLGIEATFYGVPVVNIDLDALAAPFFDEGMGRLYNETHGVYLVRRADEIAPAVEAVMTNESVRQGLFDKRASTLRHFNGGQDARASARFTDLVLRVMADSPVADRGHEAWAKVLIDAVPVEAEPVGVAGAPSASLVREVLAARPNARPIDDFKAGRFARIVHAEPLLHDAQDLSVLRRIGEMLNDGGEVVCFARHGADADAIDAVNHRAWSPPRTAGADSVAPNGYSLHGLRIILSRAGFSVCEVRPVISRAMEESGATDASGHAVEGWVVTARKSALRRTKAAFQEAEMHNNAGEAAMAWHKASLALQSFDKAIALRPDCGIYHNNRATALYALGNSEGAWDALLTALHWMPDLAAARDNLVAVAGPLGRGAAAESILSRLCSIS